MAGASRRSPSRTRLVALAGVLVVLAACSTGPGDHPGRGHHKTPGVGPNGSGPPPIGSGDLILASSFEAPICGRYQHPGPGCEFGYEGDDLSTGPYGCRTGEGCVRIGRLSHSHMGVIREVPIPGGHGYVGVGHRVPAIPDGAIPDDPGYIELEQLSPTDGVTVPGYPVEVRLHPDRRLGLALFRKPDEVLTKDPIPVDRWIYLVVELNNGSPAPIRMWVYGPDDQLLDSVEISLDDAVNWGHSDRTAQKIGGVTSTDVPMFTYEDDWYISEAFMGPAHIDPRGEVLKA